MENKHKHALTFRFLLLFGIGVSNIGDWIYLIALNLMVLNLTHSPLAVALLYLLKPFATLLTNGWSGSLIDRMNKRLLMLVLDFFRALILIVLIFTPSMEAIYLIVVVVNMAGAIFSSSSIVYMTKLIPKEKRKQFNAFESLISSGAFLLGPAIAGLLFMIGTPRMAILINALSFLFSGLITLFMPNLETQSTGIDSAGKLDWNVFKNDLKAVLNFVKANRYISMIYLLFSFVIVVMPSSVDSLEASFAKEVLLISDSKYGFLVSLAGMGFVIGAITNACFVSKVSTSLLIGMGSALVAIGYVIYSFSNSFNVASIGFFVLSFFLAFANTGFLTFFQDHIPPDIMGRVGSIFGLFEAVIIIFLTASFGIAAQLVSIRFIIVVGTVIMLSFSILLCALSVQRSKMRYYKFEDD